MEIETINWKKKLAITTAGAFIALLYCFVDARTHAFPKCPFYCFVHLYCPGCGSQRALSALLHGDFVDAIHDNFLFVLFLPLLLYWIIVSFRFNGERKVLLFYNVLFVRIVLIVVFGFWILRNVPVYPFSILAPLN